MGVRCAMNCKKEGNNNNIGDMRLEKKNSKIKKRSEKMTLQKMRTRT